MKNGIDDFYPISWPQEGVAGATGAWRLKKPVVDKAKCTNCEICWVFCPEAVINREDITIDYEFCKGCGICAEECPRGAIEMVLED